MAETANVKVWPRLTVLLPIGLRTKAGLIVAVVCESPLALNESVTVKVTVYVPDAL